MRRVLDDRHADDVERVEIAPLPGEMDEEDGLRPLGDERRKERGVQVEIALADVAEDRGRAAVLDDVGGRRPQAGSETT